MNTLSRLADSIRLGADAVDDRLVSGLVRGAVHEVYGDDIDASAATGFALLLAHRAAAARPIVIVRTDRSVADLGRLYGEGLVELGLRASDVILVHSPDDTAALRVAADAVACSGIGAVVFAPWRGAPVVDLTASRRLALRAERSRVFTLVVRIGVDPVASAAATRWHVTAAPSTALAAQAPGYTAFEINLLRNRRGIAGFTARVEWDRDRQRFCDPPLRGAVPAVAARRTGDPGERRAA